MRWRDGRRSSNIDDRRGKRMSRGVKMGGGLAIAGALAALLLGNDMGPLIKIIGNKMLGGSQTQQQTIPQTAEDNTAADFVSVILADTEDVWGPIFKQNATPKIGSI